MKLSDKQIEVIKLMRDGFKILVKISEGNRVNKYYMSNSINPMRRRPIIDLWDENLILYRSINYCKGEFELTELGKTIEL